MLDSVVPAKRTDPEIERRALGSAALLAAPWERSLLVAGKDAARFLHSLLTQDILGLLAGETRPAALATRKGHLLADLSVYRENETRFRLRIAAPFVAEAVNLFDRHRFAEKVEWRLEPGDPACFLLVGPEAAARLALRSRADSETEGASTPLAGGGAIPECGESAHWMQAEELTPGDRLLVVTPEAAGTLRDLLEVPEIGWAAFDRARIARGRAWFGIDADSERLVPEPGWDDRISYAKGCYLGQETLARLHYLGQLNWRLARLSVKEGDGSAAEISKNTGSDLSRADAVPRGADLFDSKGDRVGWITSSALGDPGLVALGYLHRKFRENPGELRLADGRLVAVVDPAP